MSENLAGTGARMVLVAVDDDTDPAYGATFAAGSRMARESGAELLVYDRSAESYLVDPYPYHEGLDDTVTIDAAGARALLPPNGILADVERVERMRRFTRASSGSGCQERPVRPVAWQTG